MREPFLIQKLAAVLRGGYLFEIGSSIETPTGSLFKPFFAFMKLLTHWPAVNSEYNLTIFKQAFHESGFSNTAWRTALVNKVFSDYRRNVLKNACESSRPLSKLLSKYTEVTQINNHFSKMKIVVDMSVFVQVQPGETVWFLVGLRYIYINVYI